MAHRPAKEQKEHDRVVAAVMKALRPAYPEALLSCNPLDEENDGIVYIGDDNRRAAAFPDALVRKQGSGIVIEAVEIETPGTVTEEEAGEWAVFAALSRHQLIGSFRLCVPAGLEETARAICDRLGIRTDRFSTYRAAFLGYRLEDVS
ncbi:MAG: hypothetical protein IT210_23300 [Armatimonadetes bacterium]|nr:hypothetical protein [Armatimonadota bacterium]